MRHIGNSHQPHGAGLPQSAIEIRHRERSDGRIAAVGLWWNDRPGARTQPTISGVVNVHGSSNTRPVEPSSIRARILVCHGALDPHVPMSQASVVER
jgi:hypothetical protein